MKRTHTLITGVVTGIALAVAGATYAQRYRGMGSGAWVLEWEWVWGPVTGGWQASVRGDGADVHLSNLKAQLKITAAQEDAWQTFAAQAKQQAASMQAMRAQMQTATGTAPEQMGQHAAAMQQRAAGMATMTSAFGVLYAALTPEQKTIADQNVGMMGRHGRGFGGGAG